MRIKHMLPAAAVRDDTTVGSPVVSVRGLEVRAHGRRILDGVDLTLTEGAGHALLGPNGAGKTTLLRVLAGLVRPSAGRVEVSGQPAVVFDAPRFPTELTVADTVRYHGRLAGSAEDPSACLERVGLGWAADTSAGRLSLGMGQRLCLAIGLVQDARVLLLDEPTTGLDPLGVAQLLAVLHDLRTEGRTVLLSSHHLAEVESVCDEVTVLVGGRTVLHGASDDLAHDHPATTWLLRTGDDHRARALLTAAGIDVEPTGRGIRATGVAPDAMLRSLAGEVAIIEIGPEQRLLERVFAAAVDHKDRS
jgi:ABC-2 type transport system ATP-binding protein